MVLGLSLALASLLVDTGSCRSVRHPRVEKAPKLPFRQVLNNSADIQYTAELQLGQQKLRGLVDTGSFDFLVFSQSCGKNCGPAPRQLYASAHSATHKADESRHASQQSFGSGTVKTSPALETVAMGPIKLPQFPISEVVWAQMPLLHTATFEAILGMGPSPKDAERRSLTEAVGASRFSLCVGRHPGSPGVLVWGDEEARHSPKFFNKLLVEGQVHWALRMRATELAGEEGRDDAALLDLQGPTARTEFEPVLLDVGKRGRKHAPHAAPRGSADLLLMGAPDGARHASASGTKFETVLLDLGERGFVRPHGAGAPRASVDLLLSGAVVAPPINAAPDAALLDLGKHASNQSSRNTSAAVLDLGCRHGCAAVLDSGTSLLAAPSSIVLALQRFLDEELRGRPCSAKHVKSLPDLAFELGGVKLRLPATSYAGTDPEGGTGCVALLSAVDKETQFGPMWIFGLPFFRQYYTTFDLGSVGGERDRAIFIARADENCEPVTGNAMLDTLSAQEPDPILPRVARSQARLAPWAKSSGRTLHV